LRSQEGVVQKQQQQQQQQEGLVQLLKQLGQCQLAGGQYEEALESFQAAMDYCGDQVRYYTK
jgi:uncharacterized protein HemY